MGSGRRALPIDFLRGPWGDINPAGPPAPQSFPFPLLVAQRVAWRGEGEGSCPACEEGPDEPLDCPLVQHTQLVSFNGG